MSFITINFNSVIENYLGEILFILTLIFWKYFKKIRLFRLFPFLIKHNKLFEYVYFTDLAKLKIDNSTKRISNAYQFVILFICVILLNNIILWICLIIIIVYSEAYRTSIENKYILFETEMFLLQSKTDKKVSSYLYYNWSKMTNSKDYELILERINQVNNLDTNI